jgi:hypothetical protein
LPLFEYLRRLFEQLLFPGVDLVRMNLIALGQISHCRLLPQRFQRDLGLLYRVNLPSRSLRDFSLHLL